MPKDISLKVFLLVSSLSELKRILRQVFRFNQGSLLPRFNVAQFCKKFLLICFQDITGHEIKNQSDRFIAVVFQT